MAEGKRYYWLKLKEDFFQSKRIKKLRHLAGGDTYTIIYLKMQLLSLRSEGVLQWTGLEDNFADELALDLDEKPEDVEVTLMYLLKTGLAETDDNVSFVFPWVLKNTGSETAAAQRMRDMRDRRDVECNNVTPLLQPRYGEKEIEKELDIEIEKKDRKRFYPPTVEEVFAYCTERQNKVDAQAFVDFYTSKNWMVGKDKMHDWKAAVRTWERRDDKASQKKWSTGETYVPPKPKQSVKEIRKLVDMI